MPSTYTGNLGIELPADGELDGVWGDVVNDNMNILDRAINGSLALALSGTSSTLTTSDGSLSDGQYKLLVLGGTPSGTHTITIAPSNAQKIYFVRNTTAQSVVFTQGSGGNVTVATGDSAIIYSDGAGAGAAVVNITNDFAMSSVKITGGTIDGTVIGGTSAAAGTFTTANATTVDTTNIEVTTLKAKDGTSAGSIADSTGVVTLASSVLTTTDINGGTIDGTVIGGSSAAAGTFTTVAASGQASFADGTAAAPSIAHTGDLNAGLFFPAADTVAVSTAGTERLRVDSSGNVGIGTTSPVGGLHINTATRTLNLAALAAGGGGGSYIMMGNSDSGGTAGPVVISSSNRNLAFNVGDSFSSATGGTLTEYMRISNAGNLGIGTSSPLAKVHSQVNTFTTADMVAYKAYNAQGVGVYANFQNSTTGTAITDGFLIGINDSEEVVLINYEATAMAFSTNATERMRINASGNVGIGNAPAAWGSSYKSLNILSEYSSISSNGNNRIQLVGNAYNDGTNWIYGGTNFAAYYAILLGQHQWFNAPSGTGGTTATMTQAMTLDNSGNLGIGTTSPAVKLHVVSSTGGILESLRLQNDSTFATSGRGTQISFRGTSGGLLGTITASTSTTADNQGVLNYSANGATSAHLFTTNSTERMRIDASGNVGIGVTPSAWQAGSALQMAGGQGYSRFGVTNNSYYDGAAYRYVSTAAATLYGNSSGSHLWFNAPSGTAGNAITFTQAMTLDASGNLGIGTTSPSFASGSGLEINGGAGQARLAIKNSATGGSSTDGFQIAVGTDSSVYLEQRENTFLGFSTNAIERARIDSSGNVGIGNTAPVTKLHVTGASITTGVVYKAQPAQTSKAAAATLTIAELLTGIVQYTGAAATLTLPTGTSIEGGLPATFPTDMSFDVSFINTGAGLLTIGANGNTTVGTMTVATLTSAMLRFRKTATNTYTVYRIS